MANYRIAQDAKSDLMRIYRTGFDRWGEAVADKYYASLFERFEQLAEQPLCILLSRISARIIEKACVALTPFTIVSLGMVLKL